MSDLKERIQIKEHMQIKEYMKKYKKVIIKGVAVAAVCVTLTAVWVGTRHNAYAVTIDGEVVGIVKTKEEAKKAYEEVVNKLSDHAGSLVTVKETLEVEPVRSSKEEIATSEILKETLIDTVSYEIQAYEIVIDDVSYATVSSKEEAARVVEEMISSCLNNVDNVTLEVTDSQGETQVQSDASWLEAEKVQAASMVTQPPVSQNTPVNEQGETKETLTQELPETVVENVSIADLKVAKQVPAEEEEGQKIARNIQSYGFNEGVVIRSCYVDPEKILDETTAKEKLESGRSEMIDYTLQDGDNIWDIAVSFDTTMERILELNSQIADETKMQVGEVIKVEALKPILSITTVEDATFKEIIPGEIQYIPSQKLYEGETLVLGEGGDGLKELTVEVTKVNGEEESRKVISEKILKEPKIRVIAYGVKEKEEVTSENNSNNSSGNSSNSNNSSSSQSGGYIHPLKGAGSISSTYGARWGTFHYGQDYAAPAGTPIYAAKAGKVIYSSYNNGGYGKLVIIEHSDGSQTYYAHCSSLYVNVGENVSQGEHIAAVGTTGDSTGNHLHLEIRINGSPVNPSKYL